MIYHCKTVRASEEVLRASEGAGWASKGASMGAGRLSEGWPQMGHILNWEELSWDGYKTGA